MRDRNNPLKNIPQKSFTIIQTSHTEFHKDLADIPVRFPTGRITYINNHQFVPLLKVKEEYQDRIIHLEIPTLSDLLTAIESDKSAILFIEYHISWFTPDKADEMLNFNNVCRKRALQGGPVVVLTAIMDRALLALDGKADYFFQMSKIRLKGKCLAIKEQVHLDEVPVRLSEPVEKGKMFGQVKLGEW